MRKLRSTGRPDALLELQAENRRLVEAIKAAAKHSDRQDKVIEYWRDKYRAVALELREHRPNTRQSPDTSMSPDQWWNEWTTRTFGGV